ncbi:hypothetical protein D3C73_1440650 [compost metagenome]
MHGLLSAALAGSREGSTYVALGADELAHVFSVARRLKQLSLQLDRCSALRIAPTCWWTPGRDDEAMELAAQLGQPDLGGELIDCGHFQIPRDEKCLAGIEEVLVEFVERVALC